MNSAKDKIIDICLEEIVGAQTPPDLTEAIMSAWKAEQATSVNSQQPPEMSAAERRSAGVNAIIDVCLEEIVAEKSPPDLTEAILASWATRSADDLAGETQAHANSAPPISCNGKDKGQFATPPPVKDRNTAQRRKTGSRRSLLHWATVASVLALGTFLGITALQYTQQAGDSEIVTDNGTDIEENGSPERKAIIADHAPKKGEAPGPNEGDEIEPPFGRDKGAGPSIVDNQSPNPVIPGVKPKPHAEIVAAINQYVQSKWQEHAVRPVGYATDDEWCRRVYLRLLGRIPNPAELQAFQNDEAPNRRNRLTDRILESSEYADAFADNWSEIWTNVLIGRSGGADANGLANRKGMRKYLRDSILANKPYDEMAFELISATGSSRIGSKDFNGAVNFLLASMEDKDGILATSRTAKIFQGRRLNCVQCHDHPSNDASQREFWQVNAFFRQMVAVRKGNNVRLLNKDYLKNEAVVFYEQKDGQVKATYPVFPDGREAPRTGKVEQYDRRTAFAEYVQHSSELSRSLVNRIWSHVFGFGFTKPVDDMGHHNQASHPELLDHLAQQFAAHRFDTKRLMKWMVLSEPFIVSSRVPDGNNFADVPESGQQLFSRYYARPLQPEEVYRSLMMVANIRNPEFGGEAYLARQQGWMQRFMKNRGTDEGEESNQFEGINAAAHMMSGLLMREATSLKPGGILHGVINSDMSNDKKVEHLFVAAVARKPLKREIDLVRKMIKQAGGDVAGPLQDIWWALLNSNEFILDH